MAREAELVALGDQELPERIVTGAVQDADRSGDLRPEVHEILDLIETADRGVLTLADIRPAGIAYAVETPATIRVWRRGLDGSTASCSGRVDTIPFEQYVKGVLPHEWIRSWDEESLEAGAVAIRTYAAWWVAAGGKYSCADLDDTTASQVYKDEFFADTDAAVDATAGVYLVKDGELVFAEYSAENSDPTAFGVSEPHCTGLDVFGHGRGTCQWGTQRWATAGKTFDWIAKHYYPGAELIGLDPVFDAGFAAESYATEMVSGEEIVVWLEYENLGNQTWTPDTILVGATDPADRDSPFYVEGNWVSPSRPTGADHSTYTPGTVGRFTWVMRAPEVTETTVFTERFALVTEGGEWFGPTDSTVTWTIVVQPASGGEEPPGEAPGDPRDPSDPDDPDDPSDDGAGMVSGGCAVAGGGSSAALALIVLALGIALSGRRAWIAALAALVAACAAGPDPLELEPRRSSLGGTSPLVDVFDDAADEFGVPAEVLATVAYSETRLRFDGTHKHESHGGMPEAIGVMALHDGGERDLARAAALAGVDPEAARTDVRDNVRAAAALLAALADDAGSSRAIADWAPAVAAYGGEALSRQVMRHVELGWRGLDADGRTVVCSSRLDARLPGSDGIGQHSYALGYPGAIWNPAHSSNYSAASRGAGQINYVIVHTTQGSYSGAISWFKNSSSNVSAHYVIRSSDGEVTQMVDDSDIGWHDACFNSETIGIEHEGFVSDPDTWYTEAMYMASAELTAWLTDQYGIPKDRAHIMGHGEAPDCSSHTDPGGGWDWDHYMDLIQTGGEPVYDAGYQAEDTPTEMVSGEELVVWVEFVNQSNFTWGLNETRLGTQNPQDRASPFFVEGNWMSPSRATGADHSTYSPGTVGRFTFVMRAPEVDEPTLYEESFQLVQEGEAWFGPVVTMSILVNPVGGGDPDPDPDPDVDDGLGADPSDELPGDGDGALVGGCSAAGGAPSGWCAIMLGVALLVRRRRSRR